MKTSIRLLGTAAVLSLLAACASHTPVIDYRTSNKTQAEYERDLAECQSYAEDRGWAGDTAVGTLGGGALGAALGAATGMIVGSPGTGAAMGAAIGGIGGGAGAGGNAAYEQKRIINTCMSRRGYNVLE
ncbi:hypothetical protein CKO38_12415 [Rhodospirillum rubrum]|uniref:hypothetical protein n=1 Tax=Rhodospirillum rubrum TaxID=1085 RepID=UPI0019051274|nr:hypothetical protein [Rhodospirillum rubrum]MBK1665383.1 hypothetical protein [Rhodospirillum rubrum]MBK1677454.1 hypothetical protein [Rhodospirillum rubrum]